MEQRFMVIEVFITGDQITGGKIIGIGLTEGEAEQIAMDFLTIESNAGKYAKIQTTYVGI